MTNPAFPKMRSLAVDDRGFIESFMAGLPTYSDFNFTSMWIWNVGMTKISTLGGNLIVQFSDYITSELFYSVCGSAVSPEVMATVLDHSTRQCSASYLKLIPEHAVPVCSEGEGLVIEEDRDNHDYIYSLESLGSYVGSRFRAKRNGVHRIRRRGSLSADCLDLKRIETQIEVLSLFERWRLRKGLLCKDTEHELSAVRRLLDIADAKLVAVGVRDSGSLIACSISEVLRDGFAICHFEKADIEYEGIYAYLMQQAAQHLMQYNCSFLNYEQDLGVAGLRFSKSAYYPCAFLRKYRVSLCEQVPTLTDKVERTIATKSF